MKVKTRQVASKEKDIYDIVHLLGGNKYISIQIKSEFDYWRLSAAGIPKTSVDYLTKYMGISKKHFSTLILHRSIKTMERKMSDELLDTYTSSRVIEVAKVMEHAYEVFEEETKVKKWLNTPNRALNGKTPLELIELPTGLVLVDEVLGRIEEGVYS